MVAWEGQRREEGKLQRGIRIFLEMMNMFVIWIVVMVLQMHTYKKSSYVKYAHILNMQFIVCQLHLNKAVKNVFKNPIWLNHEHINGEY